MTNPEHLKKRFVVEARGRQVGRTRELARHGVLPTLAEVKARATEMQAAVVASGGKKPPRAAVLEQIARHYGYRDWNTFSAVLTREEGTLRAT